MLISPPAALVLTYARTGNCLKLVDDLRLSGCREIFIFIDGGRTSSINNSQRQLLNTLGNGISGLRIHIRKSPINRGIALSMISALDWFFDNRNEGIILEDDLQISEAFLPFTSLMLNLFESDETVAMISGNNYRSSKPSELAITWSNYPQTWGWATWKRSWIKLRDAYESPIEFRDFLNFSSRRSFWAIGANNVKRGLIDTWDIPIAESMKKQGLYSIIPPKNLVTNVGNDPFATHTNHANFPMGFPIGNLNINELKWSESFTDRKTISLIYDTFLEDKVFKIKPKHSLLLFKELMVCNRKNSLAQAIKEPVLFEDFFYD